MVSLEDILSFMKRDKVDRAEQRKEDMLERAQQRREDMDMIKEMIKEGVRVEVLAAIEPLSIRQEKLEEKQKYLEDRLEEMSKEIRMLKLKDSEAEKMKGRDSENVEEADNLIIDDEKDETKEIVSAARRTVGLHKINQEVVDKYVKQGDVDETEARFRAVKEYMKNEMKVSEEVVGDMHIEKVFPPAKADWNTLYVKFASESSVHMLYSHARNMKAALRLVPYIPKQFFSRYRELGKQAYQLRHSEAKYKTRIKMGISDLVLYKREPFQNSWSMVIPTQISSSNNTETPHLNLRPNSGFNYNSKNSS